MNPREFEHKVRLAATADGTWRFECCVLYKSLILVWNEHADTLFLMVLRDSGYHDAALDLLREEGRVANNPDEVVAIAKALNWVNSERMAKILDERGW